MKLSVTIANPLVYAQTNPDIEAFHQNMSTFKTSHYKRFSQTEDGPRRCRPTISQKPLELKNLDTSGSTPLINSQIQKIIAKNSNKFKELVELSKLNKNLLDGIKTTKIQSENEKEKSLNLRNQFLGKNSTFHRKFANKFAKLIAQKFPNENKKTVVTKINYEIEIEGNSLRIQNFLTNQRSQFSLTHFCNLFEDYYNLFFENETSNLSILTAKFEVITALKGSLYGDTFSRFFWRSQKSIVPKMSLSYILSFMSRNYDCQAIRTWLQEQTQILNSKKSLIRADSLKIKSSLVTNTKKELLPKIYERSLKSRRFTILLNEDTIYQISNKSSVSRIQLENISKPKVVDFFQVLYFVYDKLLENFFADKIKKVKSQIEVSDFYKENVSNLIKESNEFFQYANCNERAIIMRVKKRVDVSANLVPLDFRVASLEGILQKHTYYQGDNAMFYRKYFKNQNKTEMN